MTELQVLQQTNLLGKELRVYGTVENPLFLAKDVAECINYAKTGRGTYDVSNMLNTVDEDEKVVRTVFVSGQNRQLVFLTEYGLYEILMRSRKPIAKQFRKGVKEILKEIRLNGKYSSDKKMLKYEDDIQKLKAKNLVLSNKAMKSEEGMSEVWRINNYLFDTVRYLTMLRTYGEYVTIEEFVDIAVKMGLGKNIKEISSRLSSYEYCLGITSENIKNGWVVQERVVRIDETGKETVEIKPLITLRGLSVFMNEIIEGIKEEKEAEDRKNGKIRRQRS